MRAKGNGWGRDAQGEFAYIRGLGLLGWSLETRTQSHSKQLSYIQENLPLAGWSSHFFFSPIRIFFASINTTCSFCLYCLQVTLLGYTGSGINFFQTGWCKVGWGKPVLMETPLSPGNLAVTPSPGLTPKQGRPYFFFLVFPSLTRPGCFSRRPGKQQHDRFNGFH